MKEHEMIEAIKTIKKYCTELSGCNECPIFKVCHSYLNDETPNNWQIEEE